MKILITDDTERNIDTAKKAVKSYSMHEFVFTTSAKRALTMINEGKVDAVITDFFFPRKQLDIPSVYGQYIKEYNESAAEVVVRIPKRMGQLAYTKRIENNRFILTKSEFAAYGGAIALTCIANNLPFVIISDMHRHRLDFVFPPESGDPTRTADSVLLLAPLVTRGILGTSHLLDNYHNKHYLGMGYPKDKTDSWTKAIDMVLSQLNRADVKKEKRGVQETYPRKKRNSIKTSEKAIQLFVNMGEADKPYYKLNNELHLDFKDDQDAALYLVEAIRFWHKKRGFFCHDNTGDWKNVDGKEKVVDWPEDKWSFSYKTPSTCGGCVSGQKILDKIFGDRGKFNSLPFVNYHGDRSYSFRFELLKYFAENGHDKTVELIETRKKEAARKKAEAEAEKQRKRLEAQKAKLAEKFDGTEISDALQQQILPYIDKIIVVNENVAVMQDDRSEWGSSGGIGYWDQVHVFCGSQRDMREWQWRDRFSASRDRHDLSIHSIGKVEVSDSEDDKITVKVELINREYGNRTTTFTFDQLEEVTAQPALSAEDQMAFTATVEKEKARIMEKLDQMWERKPQMLPSYPTGMMISASASGYVNYRRPSIKQQEIHPEIGVAAFVTEEQIDHRTSDAQMRYELFVLTSGSEKAECKAEDHGYNRDDGGAFLTILEVKPDCIVINTKRGKQTIEI